MIWDQKQISAVVTLIVRMLSPTINHTAVNATTIVMILVMLFVHLVVVLVDVSRLEPMSIVLSALIDVPMSLVRSRKVVVVMML
jgi:hypothetical protein